MLISLYIFWGLVLLLIVLHSIIRVVHYFHKLPMPQLFANLVDNPLRQMIQPPYETEVRHGIKPGITQK